MKKNRLILVTAFLLTFSMLSCSTLAGAFISRKWFDDVPAIEVCESDIPDFVSLKLSTVEIKVGKAGGAGAIIGQKDGWCYILTSKHVFSGRGDVAVLLKDKTGDTIKVFKIQKKNIYVDKQVDIGLIKLYLPEREFVPLKLTSEDTPTIGQEIYTIGHPVKMYYTINKGIVSNYITKTFQGVKHLYMVVSAPSFGGNSGGAIINNKGELVGIVVGIMYVDTNKSATKRFWLPHLTFAVYPEVIKRFLDDYSILSIVQ